MFGRKKRLAEDAGSTTGEPRDAVTATETDESARDPRAAGPWDENEFTGERGEYLDLGALLLKPVRDVEIRMEVDQHTQVPRAVNLDFRDGSVQLQVFTAPKSSGLWDEVRAELVAGLRRDGGEPTVSEGPLGLQVDAKFPGTTPDGRQGYRLARFVGIDGPRWFLRAVYTGGAALPGTTAEVLDDAVRGLVVVRGQDPHPPRDLLALSMPSNATVRRVGGPGESPAPDGAAQDAPGGDTSGGDTPDADTGSAPTPPQGPAVQPPRRGPEITEIG
ncbi:DUF3710 domain-containing protein [Kocuria tytonis]|uniref:DUF3710 domain-containing protein n=1 Tax=Kocuria tytonis TaxID=2054280 RepID=A0A495A935_9MICC|nr:DUF3710 domain-containing protein [Kocuria tytonis]RKQ36283.1 DUF3710 domain-containing protein [Kocuria tytonis]